MMVEELKKVLLLGIGSAAYTYDKASKIVEDMVEKGRITIDEGKELSEELKRTVKEKIDNKEDKPFSKDDMASLLKEMDLATKSDLEALKVRIEKLEKNQKNVNK